MSFKYWNSVEITPEGEAINSVSIIRLKSHSCQFLFPKKCRLRPDDDFIQKINKSGAEWFTLTDENNESKLALDEMTNTGLLFTIYSKVY